MLFYLSVCGADIIFVVDSSGSIRDNNVPGGPDNWDLTLQFVSQVITTVASRTNGEARFAAVTFSDKGELQFDFNRYGTDYNTMSQDFLVTRYLGSNTNTSGGLWVAEQQLIVDTGSGNRAQAKDLVILVTDGKATYDADKLIPIAQSIRDRNVDILGVGITASVEEQEIRALISQQSYYFTALNFNQLAQTARDVADIVCPP